MPTTHAVCVHETGGADKLVYEKIELPDPGPEEVLIRHTAIGVNFIDTYHRSGLYTLPEMPHGLGMEAAGVIEKAGTKVAERTAFSEGDRVAYVSRPPGAYAEHRVMSIDDLVQLPEYISDEQAAGMMLKGMTVEYLVRRCVEVDADMTVLWHAAAGGVGLIACQWLKSLGATTIGTASTTRKAQMAQRAGCHHVINYTEEDFVDRVRELTDGEGVHVVYDSVGKDTFIDSLDSLRRRGTLVAFGNASGAPEPVAPLELASRGSLYLTRPSLMDYIHTRGELAQSAGALFDAVNSGAVEIEVNQTWPLAEADEAHRALENRQTTGSTVLIP